MAFDVKKGKAVAQQTDWINSLKTSPVPIAFKLAPIYMLAATSERRTALQHEFKRIAVKAANQKKAVAKPSIGRFKNGHGTYLTVAQNQATRDGDVITWSEVNEEGQKWSLQPDGRIVNQHGTFLTTEQNLGGEGVKIITWSKVDEAGQKWSQDRDGRIKNGHGYFLSVASNQSTNDGKVITWRSVEEKGQKWTYEPL